VGGPHVGVDLDLHTDVTLKDRGQTTDDELDGGLEAGDVVKKLGKLDNVDLHVLVFLEQKLVLTLLDQRLDVVHHFEDLLAIFLVEAVLLLKGTLVTIHLNLAKIETLLDRPEEAQHGGHHDQTVYDQVKRHRHFT